MIKQITNTWVIAAAVSLSFSYGAMAQEEGIQEPPSTTTAVAETTAVTYQCTLHEMTRRIEIEYANAGASVPCSVNYYKDTEQPGEVNTLWHASNVEGYCEERAEAFSQKLISWGWSCTNP
ncbi:hypothetical protein [Saccharophagus degradans]|uniref:Uncharacterized protein n=1 Tax=Saccharophagus degradans TaxID=86304 RepID=A0AAW7X395_9GAMM|nr:hypothetical protein [Saccharophagus degradans]MDO6421884.1 hypothetical protein [Saccharophagus degradans]MDO6606423.1 hypothetical protein [Saccharophagus degradans]